MSADQGSDLFFVVNSMTSDNPRLAVIGIAALFFILVFSVTSGLKAFGSGKGLYGFLLAATGIDMGLRCATVTLKGDVQRPSRPNSGWALITAFSVHLQPFRLTD